MTLTGPYVYFYFLFLCLALSQSFFKGAYFLMKNARMNRVLFVASAAFVDIFLLFYRFI